MNKLIFIGLGLHDCEDISVKAVNTLKTCDWVFAEFYTATMGEKYLKALSDMVDKKIEILSRDQVEAGDKIIDKARMQNTTVGFLVPGDPFTATTHIDLLLRAKAENIDTAVFHSASITTVVPGLLGLQFYKFGRTTTLAYPDGDYFPESPYDVLASNHELGLHTLILLDIRADENRLMTANDGIELLLKINAKRDDKIFTPQTLTCVVARAGADDAMVIADSAENLLHHDFGEPMHTLAVPGKLHFKEAEALMVLANAPKSLLE